MKKALKSFLQKKNHYYKIRFSALFRCYQYLFKPNDIKKEKKEIAFYRSFLPNCNIIFDIGAYDGHKTEAFVAIANSVVSCEPDLQNFELLKQRFRNRKQVRLENKAITEAEGENRYHVHHPGSAFNTLSQKWKETLEKDSLEKWDEKIKFSAENIVQTTTLDLLIKKYGSPDFIKIDVEGYEEHVLKGLSQPISFLSFESLWPECADELQNCFNRLAYIDPDVVYNISVNEKLLLDLFTDRNSVIDYLEKGDITHLEIIVKMNK